MEFKVYLCVLFVYLTQSNGYSMYDQHAFAFNHPYAPTSLVFHDIYPHGNAIIPEEHPSTVTDEDLHINTVSTEFVEFHPQVLKIQPITSTAKDLVNSSYTTEGTELRATSPSVTSSTTHEPDEITVKVVPIKQRGVLDLLLPPTRVRAFKSVFDTFRRMLSYTFKRR